MGLLSFFKKLFSSNKDDNYNISKEKKLFSLKPGDEVSIGEGTYRVEGSISFDDEGWKWTEYKLKRDGELFWLSVEYDDEIEIGLFKEVIATSKSTPNEIEYNGILYYQQESSDAKVVKTSGRMNVSVGEWVDYYEYSDLDGYNYLSIEFWDGEIEMSVGHKVTFGEILPLKK